MFNWRIAGAAPVVAAKAADASRSASYSSAARRGGKAVIHDPSHGIRHLSMDEVSKHFTGVALELTPTPDFRPREERQSVSVRQLLGRVTGLKRSLFQIMVLALALEAPLEPAALGELLHRRMPVYDKDREGHYNLISALHKSLRGSDPDAALYWLARMLVAGEEPLYLLRRLVRFASEDIGLADSNALQVCLAAKDAYDFLGSPEGELAIVHACLYLATAPKSNAAYVAQKAAWKSAKETGSLSPPANILNAPTKLMKDIGYGAGYAYDHEAEDGFSGANYWPEEIEPQEYYRPVERGFEREVAKRLEWWDKKRAERRGDA